MRKIQSKQQSVHEKILKIFQPQIQCDQKKLVPRHLLWKIQRLEHSVNEKILNNFWPQIKHEQKKLVPRHPLSKIQSRALGKGKNSKKLLGLKFSMTKKSWPRPTSEK